MAKNMSSEKGRMFEDDVADLYRLLGAEVTQNIEISQKKVDILATFQIQGSPIKHRVIVECKDEKKAVNANQRVMQFQGLLDIARKTGEADSAEIVTRVPWGDAAKGFAYKAGISLLTYAEKISQLIDFRPYMKSLIDRFEKIDPSRPSEPPLGAYYVDLSAEISRDGKIKRVHVINNYIGKWLEQATPQRHLAIFGEYGSGKSSLCKKISYDLSLSYLHNSKFCRIPILLNLRDFIGTIKMEAYITSFLDQECKVTNPRFELFKAMNDAGLFLLIFDGLDEMAVKVDVDTLELNLLEIEKLVISPNSKILLTSRPEYFITSEEEKRAISPKLNVFATRKAEYEPIRILPWDEPKIGIFLRKRVPLIKEAKQPWTYYQDRIKNIQTLSDLSQRPVLLEMIVKTLPMLIHSNTPISLPNLYKTYLLEEIRRQKIQKRRTLLFSDEARFGLLRRLAVDIFSGSISEINFMFTRSLIERRVMPPKHELEAYTREFLTNSFLIRTGDSYNFSHKSILEYLVATHLHEEIEGDRPNTFAHVLIQPVIVEFLSELKPDTITLWKWIAFTRQKAHVGGIYLGGNAATLLCAVSNDAFAGQDLSGVNIMGADLSGADLTDTTLKDTILAETKLTFARFHKTVLETAASLRHARISFYFLTKEENPILKKLSAEKRIFIHGVKKGNMLISVLTEVVDFEDIETVRKDLAKQLSTSIAVYEDEYEKLLKNYSGIDELR